MTPADLATIEQALTSLVVSDSAVENASEALGALLRRDWAVRVLDAEACAIDGSPRAPYPRFAGTPLLAGPVSGWSIEGVGGTFDSPAEARLAAAETAWPELTDDARTELGERP